MRVTNQEFEDSVAKKAAKISTLIGGRGDVVTVYYDKNGTEIGACAVFAGQDVYEMPPFENRGVYPTGATVDAPYTVEEEVR